MLKFEKKQLLQQLEKTFLGIGRAVLVKLTCTSIFKKFAKIYFFDILYHFTPMSGRFQKGIVVVVLPITLSSDNSGPRDKIREKVLFFFRSKVHGHEQCS